MLTATHCCFRGISRAAELRLWQANCLTWGELQRIDQPRLSEKKLSWVREQVKEAEIALQCGLTDYFLNRLRPPDTIRVLPHHREGVGYLDVETTGLGKRDKITTIALYSRGRLRCFVRGRNLSAFLKHAPEASLLITYNGTQFDLPRLRKEFGIDLPTPHVDLRPCLEALGYGGGLKRCEMRMGIRRQATEPCTGKQAAELWQQYCEDGHEEALLRLLRYNLQDVLSLELLAVKVYNQVMSSYPIAVRLPEPTQPEARNIALSDVL